MKYKDFKQKVYSSLIRYKQETLKIHEKGISSKGIEHDCLLPKPYSDRKIPVMIYDGIKKTLEDIQVSPYAYKPHIQASGNIASSQTACLNLFIPVLESEHADSILKASGIAPAGFDHIDRDALRKGYCFEYWESTLEGTKGLLGDHSPYAGTDSDVAIAYRNAKGDRCLWLIEHKLAERYFTRCGAFSSKGISKDEKGLCQTCGLNVILANPNICYYHKHCGYDYWKIMNAPHCKKFFCGDYKSKGCPFRGGMNQLWRNQMLALELERRGVYKEVFFSVVTHPGNTFLDKTMEEYGELVRHSPKFFSFKSTDIVNNASSYLPDWAGWYQEVYLEGFH